MRTILVSRHPGTLDWFAQQGYSADKHIRHFNIDDIAPGDTVMGTLPIHLVAQICQLGCHYLHLTVNTPAEFRGKELTSDQLNQFGATLTPYLVTKLEKHKTA